MKTCSKCEAAHYAKGFCQRHYYEDRESNNAPCEEQGCTLGRVAKGRCRKHYASFYRNNPMSSSLRPMECGYTDCEKTVYAKGKCSTHYQREMYDRLNEIRGESPCAREGCSKSACPQRGGKLCAGHYASYLLEKAIQEGRATPCVIEGCDRYSRLLKMCTMHYHRWKKAQ